MSLKRGAKGDHYVPPLTQPFSSLIVSRMLFLLFVEERNCFVDLRAVIS